MSDEQTYAWDLVEGDDFYQVIPFRDDDGDELVVRSTADQIVDVRDRLDEVIEEEGLGDDNE